MEIVLDHICLAGKGAPRLDQACLEVPSGAFVSVLGPSGAGKSTLLGVVSGLVAQDAGSVRFDGEAVDDVPAHRRGVSVVFQDARLFPNMTALDNVAFPLKVRGVGRTERRERAARLLADVQLGGLGARRTHELSGGQRQRVALARALAASPHAVLLDEPFSGLDEALRDDMRRLVLDLHERTGTTMLMVTHDPFEALTMSDRVAYLLHGSVVQVDEPGNLLARPATPEVAAGLGGTRALEGTVEGGVFVRGRLRFPAPEAPDGPAVLLRTQAGDVSVHAAGRHGAREAADAGRQGSQPDVTGDESGE